MDDQIEEAHHELDRLQGIIDRHEGHMFTLRGWLLTVLGGLLAAYYTENVEMSGILVRIVMLGIVILFLLVDTRHVNLVEAVVERATVIENDIAKSRRPGGHPDSRWYDGPQISQACLNGARRRWPRHGMTFIINQPFYLVVLAVIIIAWVSLPDKGQPPPMPHPSSGEQVPN